MSSWQESSNDRRESNFQTPAGSNSPPNLDASLLERVLEKTLDALETTEPLESATRASLLDFARQNGGAAEFSESLLGDLVRIILRQEKMALPAGQLGGNAISDQVAHSIWDDPVAHGRISDIWRLLQGKAT